MNPHTRNITRTYRAAEDEHREHGRTWYADAWQLAMTLDPEQPTRAAGVIAALSPRVSWTQNVRMATLAYHDRAALRGLGQSLRSADRILSGEDPLTVLQGAKTSSFYRNIAGDHDSVTVDRHAYDIAVGRVTDDKTREALSRKGAYESIATLYRRAARILSREYGRIITPAEVQATTWVAWRATKTA